MSRTADTHGERRARMVSGQLESRGVRDAAVLAAMRAVPRHLFVPPERADEAYLDTPVPLSHGQTISQPYMVALMTELLGVNARSRVLEVGAGSGYQTAVLAEVAGEVWALERLASLAEGARTVLARLGYANAHVSIADGTRGWPELAPFDGVLVAAAAAEAPPALLAQLAMGGRLVIPIGAQQDDQVLTVYERGATGFGTQRHTRCRFVPLIAGPGSGAGGADAAPPPGGTCPPAAPPSKMKEDAQMRSGETNRKAVSVRAHGTVQGVYYRAGARLEGKRLGVRGWVTNRADGGVSLHLQGAPDAVDAMLDWCRGGPPAADVTRLDVNDVAYDDALSDFEVR